MKTKGKPENVLLTVPEVAALARVTRKIIWKRVKEGRIPAYRVAGTPTLRVWLYDVLLPYQPGTPLRFKRQHVNTADNTEATAEEQDTVDPDPPVNIVDTNQS